MKAKFENGTIKLYETEKMKSVYKNGTMKLYETKEVEVEILTHEQAIDFWDAFTQTLYDSIDDDCEWVDVLKHIRDFSKEACENYGIKD